MTTEEAKRKILEDENFICLKRFDYSLEKLLARYPDGCPDRIIAQALLITEDDVEVLYQKVVAKLRSLMGAEDDSVM